MALTPKIKIELTPHQKRLVDGLEALIDFKISANFDGQNDSVVRVNISDFSRPYYEGFSKVMKELNRMYDKANWSVNYVYRDGNNSKYVEFVELTPKKTRFAE